MGKPFVSIITINYNNRNGLQKTLDSVLVQQYLNYEYIVIDGGSIDGSVDIIDAINDKLVFWVSERDNGIYQAMNKGIVRATGEYCLFLNSGDYFISDKSLSRLIGHAHDKDLVYGNLLMKSRTKEYVYHYPDQITFNFFYRGESLPHAATLIKRSLFDTVGYYDENFKIVSDWIFFLKVFSANKFTYFHCNETIVVFEGDGISGRKESVQVMQEERSKVLADYIFFLPDYENYNRQNKIVKEIEKSILHRLAAWIDRSYGWKILKRVNRFITG